MLNINKMKIITLVSFLITSFGIAVAQTSSDIPVEKGKASGATSSTVDDQTLKFKVSKRLNDMYPGNNIEVTVFNNQLLLTGQVDSKETKLSVVKTAEDYSENYKVLNYLSIKKSQSAAQTSKDAWITTKLASKLLTVSGVKTDAVKVTTTNGVVYLLGNVTKDQDTTIINNARSIKGVRKVVDLLVVNNA